MADPIAAALWEAQKAVEREIHRRRERRVHGGQERRREALRARWAHLVSSVSQDAPASREELEASFEWGRGRVEDQVL